MKIREYLEAQKEKCAARLSEIDAKLDECKAKNEASEDEAELKALGDEIADLEAEKTELEAELKEVDAQIAALDAPADDQEKDKGARKAFLNFDVQKRGGTEMNTTEIEARKAAAEDFRKSGVMKIEKPQLRAVTIASGQIAIPTSTKGIENPADVPYSTILDFVKVEDMTGAGYNKVALVEAWSEAGQKAEGATIDQSNPTFGNVTISPISGFKVLSKISNEVLKTSPLNYYGKVEESAMIALRTKIAAAIVTVAVGAKDDANNAVNASYTLDELTETTLRNIAFQFGGDEGIYGPATLVLNKKDLIALGDLVSAETKEYVYEIEPNAANPNVGVIRKGGLSARYILSKALPAFVDDTTAAGTTCMLYGDLKSVEVDLFGAYDVKVSEDSDFAEDLLAIRGTAQIGIGVTRLHGLIEVKKGE